jgi:hypothetical protein
MEAAMDEWKFAVPVYLTKAELMALAEISGELSIAEYVENLVRERIEELSKPGVCSLGYDMGV